jgi:hypothetical protein
VAGSKTLTVTITGDASDLRRALRGVGDDVDDVDGKFGRAGGNMSGVMSGLAVAGGVAAAGIAGVAVGLGFLVNEAEQARKVGSETDRVLRTTGASAWITADAVAALAEETSKKTGIDDEAIQSTANWLLTFKNVRDAAGEGNDVFSQSVALSQDMATVMGGDATASATLLGKALNDPATGLSRLTRAGVTFTEQQKQQITTLAQSGDALGAQKIILAEVASQFEGAAAAAASPWDFLKVQIGNVSEALGSQLLPTVADTFTVLTDSLTAVEPALSGLMVPVASLVDGFADGLAPAIEEAAAFITELVEQVGPALAEMAEENGDSLADLGSSVADLIDSAEPLIPLLAAIISALADFQSEIFAGGAMLADVATSAADVSTALGPLGGVWGGFTSGANEGADAADGAAESIIAMSDAASASGARYAAQAQAIEDVEAAAAAADQTMEEWNATLDEIFGGGLDVFGATTQWEEAIDSLTEKLMINGATIDANSAAGRANRDALESAAKSALSLSEAYANTGDIETANALLASSRDRLIEAGMAAGATRAEMIQYLDALGLTPENIQTQIGLETPNLPETEAAIDHAARERNADIFAKHYGADAADRILSHTARDRDAPINARANGIAWVEGQLANLTRPRWVEIHTSIGPAPPGFNNAERSGGGRSAGPAGRSTADLFNQRPVVVQVDGREIGRTPSVYRGITDQAYRDRRAS